MTRRFLHLIAILFLLVAGLVIGGCATTQTASEERDRAAKSFVTKPGRATIYVYRNEHWGAAVAMDVLIDGQSIGKTGAMTYFAVHVAPGKYTLTSKAENDATLDVVVEADKSYFVWQEVKMGLLFARTKLALVDEATGRAGVNECALLDANLKQ